MMLNIADDPGYILETSDRITSGTLGSVILFVYGSHEEQEHPESKTYLLNLL